MAYDDKFPVLGLLAIGLLGCTLLGCKGGSADEASTNGDELGTDELGDSEVSDDGPQIICMPGETRCADSATIETCAATGLEWETAFCDANDSCMPCAAEDPECTGAVCIGPCESSTDVPSSAGCSFFATGMLINSSPSGNIEDASDAVVLANPNTEGDATVQIYLAPIGSNVEEPVGEPILLAPGETYLFVFEADLTDNASNGAGTSKYQSGGVYHIVSDLPIIAYQHTPLTEVGTNESSLLLPEESLRQDYVVYNHTPYAEPGYFVVVAVENQTTVRWWPTIETAGNNLPLPFVLPGEMGEYKLNRLDTMRIAASANLGTPECYQDLSGTVIESDKPIMVLSAVVGARVPYCATEPLDGCTPPFLADPNCFGTTDHIQEVNIPLDYWGTTYVGAHSPLRGTEEHYWRLFAGDDNVTITTEPPQPGTPIVLAERGNWAELVLPNATSVVFTSDKPFMPVQYTTLHIYANDMGDPAMSQAIPVEQFLSRYAFVTGIGYDVHYVQVIRELGSAPVYLDATEVTDYYTIGNFEIADVVVEEGSHDIISDAPFGIIQWGYDGKKMGDNAPAAYGYPGGMKVEQIFIP